MDAASFLSGLSDWSSGRMTESRHSSKIRLTCCCRSGGPCVSRIKSSMNTSTYSKGGPPVSCEEALGACGLKSRIVGRDSCAVPGQVAELVVVGCSTTSSADCRSVAADVVPASPIPVLRFGEYGGLVVFVVGVDVIDMSWASPVSVCGSGESCRHSVIVGVCGVVFATASWR